MDEGLPSQEAGLREAATVLAPRAVGETNPGPTGSNKEPPIRMSFRSLGVKLKTGKRRLDATPLNRAGFARATKKGKVKKTLAAPVEDDDDDTDEGDFVAAYRCPATEVNCLEIFNSIAEVDSHYARVHNRVAKSVVLADNSGLVRDLASHHRFAGQPATPRADGFGQFDTGRAFVRCPDSPVEVSLFPCDICGKNYGTSSDLLSHMQRRHQQRSHVLLDCPYPSCHLQMKSPGEMAEHMLNVHCEERVSQTNQESRLRVSGVRDTAQMFDGLSLNHPKASSSVCHDVQCGSRSCDNRSGAERTVTTKPRVQVTWPHMAFDTILGQKSYKYGELSFPALMAGMIKGWSESPEFGHSSAATRRYMAHLSLLTHAESVCMDTTTTRDFNKSVLSLVETGVLSWHEESSVAYDQMRLFFLTSLRPKSVSITRRDDGGNKFLLAKRIVCKEFGDGTCTKSGDHGEELLHICFACLAYRGSRLPHSRSNCPEDKRIKAGRK